MVAARYAGIMPAKIPKIKDIVNAMATLTVLNLKSIPEASVAKWQSIYTNTKPTTAPIMHRNIASNKNSNNTSERVAPKAF